MRPIDKVKQHARVTARRKLQVEEWETDLYFSPLTTNDMIAVAERMGEEGRDVALNEYERRVVLVILKAELEDGTKAFEFGDRIELMANGSWPIVNRIVAFIYETSAPSLEDAKKKSGKTGDSGSS